MRPDPRPPGGSAQYDAYKTAGSSPPKHESDLQLIRQSTIFLLDPLTDSARAWTDEHIPTNATRFGAAIVIEHCYITDVVAGIRESGLRIV